MHLGLADLDKSAELIAEHASLLEKALLVVQAVLDRLALLGHACLKGFERSRRGAAGAFAHGRSLAATERSELTDMVV